jgi:hypothetical protein
MNYDEFRMHIVEKEGGLPLCSVPDHSTPLRRQIDYAKELVVKVRQQNNLLIIRLLGVKNQTTMNIIT